LLRHQSVPFIPKRPLPTSFPSLGYPGAGCLFGVVFVLQIFSVSFLANFHFFPPRSFFNGPPFSSLLDQSPLELALLWHHSAFFSSPFFAYPLWHFLAFSNERIRLLRLETPLPFYLPGIRFFSPAGNSHAVSSPFRCFLFFRVPSASLAAASCMSEGLLAWQAGGSYWFWTLLPD